jgi:hypothetical protein
LELTSLDLKVLTDAQKAGFKDNPVIPPGVNLVHESLGCIHNITLSKHKLSPTFGMIHI